MSNMSGQKRKWDHDFSADCCVCYDPLPEQKDCTACRLCTCVVCNECYNTMPLQQGRKTCPLCRAPMPRTVEARDKLSDLVHAFHCTDTACPRSSCAATKVVFKRMERHALRCTLGETACKVCKLWRALGRTSPRAGQPVPAAAPAPAAAPPPAANLPRNAIGVLAPAGEQADAAMVANLVRRIDPAELKRLLLLHVRQCNNRQCRTCARLRERIRANREEAAAAVQMAPP